MSSRIDAALDVTELVSKYKDRFKNEQMNDSQVSLCIKSPGYKMLAKVIDSPEDYDLFVDAFSNPEKFRNIDLSDSFEQKSTSSAIPILKRSPNPSPINSLLASILITTDAEDSTDCITVNDIPDDDRNNNLHENWASSKFATLSPTLSPKINNRKFKSGFFSNIKLPSFSKSESGTSPKQGDGFAHYDGSGTISRSASNTSINAMISSSPTSQSMKLPTFSHPLKVQPVQIIDIPLKETTPDGVSSGHKGSLIFHHKELEAILSKIGRRPVALLSIAGPSRQGKSFILGYMLRYLQSLSHRQQLQKQRRREKQQQTDHHSNHSSLTDLDFELEFESDWMGKSDYKKNQPLLGGFLWRSGVERETTGIWMWPEAFPITAEDGTEFDVLLVDTQGVFDDYTDKKDWATIVGLSLLTSSCLIFNISHSLQEDSLITLKDFMDFGLMAKNPTDANYLNTSEEKPFQKLLFLIRDWNAPDDYPYGAEGGADYLEWNLERKNNRNGAQLRKQIKQCFQQLDCFLMPEPGPFVRRKTYDGSVAGMGPEFADNIEKFIEHLFDPSTFPYKIISGNLVTGNDLLVYFEQFVKIFNSDQMPTPEDMNQATAFICNQTIVNKCLAVYEQSMQQQQLQAEQELQRRFLLEKELQDKNESALHQALELFHYSRKMGTLEEINKFKADLLQRVGDSLKLATVINLTRQQDAVEEATLKLEAYFISLMEEKLSRSCLGPDEFVIEETFESIHLESEISSQQFLQQILHIEFLDSIPKALQNFQNVLQSLKEPMKIHNKMKRCEMEHRLKEEVTKLSNKYKSQMLSSVQKFRYWTQDQMQEEDKIVCDEIVSDFSTIYEESSLSDHGKLLLSESLQKELEDVANLVKVHNENYLMSCQHLVSELANAYTTKMEERASDGELSPAHQEETHNCLNSLKNSEDFYRLPVEETEKLVADLSTRINTTCQQLVDKWFPRIRQRLIKSYKERINAIFYGNAERPFDQIELEQEHQKQRTIVFNEFQKFISEIPKSEEIIPTQKLPEAKILEDFETEIDNHMETIYEKNKLRVEALHATLNGLLSKAKGMYLQLSKHINEECHPSSKFNQLNEESKEQILQYFQEECETNEKLAESLPLDFDLQPSLLELEEYMDSVSQFKKVGPTTLEISAPVIKFSRELGTLENIIYLNPGPVKEVRWLASKEIHIDENLCGEFWSGLNLAIYTKKIFVVGNERLIVVSGENGRSAPGSTPVTPSKPGTNGVNGIDGEPGESGGNIVIIAEEIHQFQNLRLVSNGGQGGNGQPGGNGSDGQDGVNGDDRYPMTVAELERKFPSPAKFVEVQVKDNLRSGLQTMKDLAQSSDEKVTMLDCINTGSRCWTLETKEGAIFRYGFYQGNMKGLISGRSFYVWFQGAPGTLGQFGGKGGLGGRGGYPGNPGDVEVPKQYENEMKAKGCIVRRQGDKGVDGRKGVSGKNGVDGTQGMDYAIVDPYAGLYVPSNFISKKYFGGRLEMYVVDDGKRDGAAYCPHEKEYISFTQTISLREGIHVYEQPPDNERQKPMKNTRKKNPIRVDASHNGDVKLEVVDEDLVLQPKNKNKANEIIVTSTIGRAGEFCVEESELRCCIENEFLGTSVVDTYASVLSLIYSSDEIAYIPNAALCFTDDKWSIALTLEDMIQNLKDNSTSSLTTVTTIVNAGKHWMLFVANAAIGQIGIVDTLCGYCSDEKLNDGVLIFIKMLDAIFGEMEWNAKYFLETVKQNDSNSCGPAVLYFLEQLYLNCDFKCDDPFVYQKYRKTIVKRILQTTEEGSKILEDKNVYTQFLGS